MRSGRPVVCDESVTTAPQYAPPVRVRAARRIVQHWDPGSPEAAQADTPRDDLLLEECVAPGTFEQAHGPFVHYRRTVNATGDSTHRVHQTIEYQLRLPWFGWLYAPFVRRALKRRPGPDHPAGKQPWWAPGDRLDPRQVLVLGILAGASMCSTFTNTLFTQFAHKASEAFGVGNTGQGVGGAVVRAGIVICLPFAFRSDQLGRRRVMRWLIVAAPLVCALGALAPNFPLLVATQTVGRPLGLALDLLIAVVAAEEVPRNSRAYAVSVIAMAGGIGAGLCVWMLPLSGAAPWGWRIPFAATVLWLLVARSVYRHLPETVRFESAHAEAPRLATPRLSTIAFIGFCTNLFLAPASFFQNRYLDEVRGYSNLGVSLFTVLTAMPGGIGLLVGGALADRFGRRFIGAASMLLGSFLIEMSFVTSGVPMWGTAIVGGVWLGIAVPALMVYRTELFPTASRGRAGGIVTTASLFGGVVGLVITGQFLDRNHSYGAVLGALSLTQLLVAALVLRKLPESAHLELEDLNPEDRNVNGLTSGPLAP